MGVVLDLLGMGVGLAGKPAHSHPHGQVHPLHMGGADMLLVRHSDHGNPGHPQRLLEPAPVHVLILAVILHDDGIVDVPLETPLNGVQVSLVPIAGQLDPLGQPTGQVLQEHIAGQLTPVPHLPAHQEFGIRVEGGPGPYLPEPLPVLEPAGQVAVLGIDEAPHLIHLHPFGGEVAHMGIMVAVTGLPDRTEQLIHGIGGNPRNPPGGAHGITLNEEVEDLGTFGQWQDVHGPDISYTCLSSQAKTVNI